MPSSPKKLRKERPGSPAHEQGASLARSPSMPSTRRMKQREVPRLVQFPPAPVGTDDLRFLSDPKLAPVARSPLPKTAPQPVTARAGLPPVQAPPRPHRLVDEPRQALLRRVTARIEDPSEARRAAADRAPASRHAGPSTARPGVGLAARHNAKWGSTEEGAHRVPELPMGKRMPLDVPYDAVSEAPTSPTLSVGFPATAPSTASPLRNRADGEGGEDSSTRPTAAVLRRSRSQRVPGVVRVDKDEELQERRVKHHHRQQERTVEVYGMEIFEMEREVAALESELGSVVRGSDTDGSTLTTCSGTRPLEIRKKNRGESGGR